jgi:large subunit ribosomal protein L35
MPKKKTKKAAAKRFRVTANGKVKFSRSGSGHLLGSKSRKRKRSLRKSAVLSDAMRQRVVDMVSR